MKFLKFTSVFICLMTAASLAVSAVPGKINGAVGTVTSEIKLENGTKTGVTLTEMTLPKSTYFNPSSSNDKKACFTEFDLSNTNLSVEVINCGKSMVSATTVKSAVEAYNESGKTVLAAINGDLWMTSVHSGSEMAKAVLKVPRGIMISKGEIWATQQIGMENACATNDERGTTTPPKAAFGVTSQNQPIVGSPNIIVSVKNETTGIAVTANGLNRLPAPDSTIIYNHRCYSTNYALDDSFEIEIESDNTAFTLDGTVKGKIKAIYESGSTTRPAIGKNTIVITVRGNRIPAMKENFQIGNEVSFKCTINDTTGNTQLWKDVKEAIGGHIMTLKDGQIYTSLGGNTEYPGAFVGYKDDGSVMFTTLTAAKDGTRLGLNYSTGVQFLRDAGYNSVFFLDGGGSATMVTLENGSYTVRSKSSDGSPRAVINALAVVWNDTKVCPAQGSLSYISAPVDLSDIPGYHLPADLMPHIVSGHTNCTGKYIPSTNSYDMTISATSNDPYATLSFEGLGAVSADEYKYIVFKAKTNLGRNSTLKLYYSTSVSSGPSEAYTKNVSVSGDGSWNYYTADLSSNSGWKGTISNIRLDIFDSITTGPADGTAFSFGSITLCKTSAEAAKVAAGNYLPDGAISSYEEYLNPGSGSGETSAVETSAPTEETAPPETEPSIGEPDVITDTAVADETASPVEDTSPVSTNDGTEAEESRPSETLPTSTDADTDDVGTDGEDSSSVGVTVAIICAVAAVAVAAVLIFIKKRKQ